MARCQACAKTNKSLRGKSTFGISFMPPSEASEGVTFLVTPPAIPAIPFNKPPTESTESFPPAVSGTSMSLSSSIASGLVVAVVVSSLTRFTCTQRLYGSTSFFLTRLRRLILGLLEGDPSLSLSSFPSPDCVASGAATSSRRTADTACKMFFQMAPSVSGVNFCCVSFAWVGILVFNSVLVVWTQASTWVSDCSQSGSGPLWFLVLLADDEVELALATLATTAAATCADE
mmetsp:Transcript_4869/g.9697  ORF Transcript_4869/g.9697 Transcript_4869/m.9697 type:complete len:231 (+) Transcript_4869:1622-2314(+)